MITKLCDICRKYCYNRHDQTSKKKIRKKNALHFHVDGRGMLKELSDNLNRIFVILHTSITPAIGKSARFAFDAFEFVEVPVRSIGAGSREPAKEKRIGLQ